jgi:hypothetical protein
MSLNSLEVEGAKEEGHSKIRGAANTRSCEVELLKAL